MSKIIDRPWAIVYGPNSKLGPGLMYGLGGTRQEAWVHAVLVLRGGYPASILEIDDEIKGLKRKGMVARRVEVRL